MSREFPLPALILCITPGDRRGPNPVSHLGRRMAGRLRAAVGCTLATLLHLAVAMAGPAAVPHSSAVRFQALERA